MKSIKLTTTLLTVAILAGCSSTTPSTTKPATTTVQPTMTVKPNMPNTNKQGLVQNFVCNNGLEVQVKYLNNEQAMLTSGEVSAMLKLSNGRYVASNGLWGNQGGEWHEVGNTAMFSYKGVHDNKTSQTTCNVM